MTSKAERDTLLRTFQRFDSDGSNSIDTTELRNVMEHLGVHMGESQLWALVEQIDKNKNGELEFDEFRQLMNMWKEASRFRLFDGEGVKSLVDFKIAHALSTTLFMTDSWTRCLFDGAMATVACVMFIILLYDDVSHMSNSFVFWTCLAAHILFFVDFLVSMFTVNITEENQVEDSVRPALFAYAKSWMAPDMLAFLPWDVFFTGTAAVVLRHLLLLKLFKMKRFWRASGRMPMTGTYINFHFKTLPIILLLVQYILLIHFFSCAMVLVKTQLDTDPLVAANDGHYPYVTALYFVVYSFGTVGYGDVDITGTVEKWFACVVLLSTLISNAFIVGKLISIMQKANIESERVSKLRETLSVLQHFHIPSQLQDEVLQFQDHMLGHSLSTSYASIVEGLPQEMQSNISLFVKLRLLCAAPQLNGSHYIVQVAVAEALLNHVALPEQSIVAANEETTTMYFIAHGFVDVYAPDGGHLTTLQTGEYFGDNMPYQNASSLISVKALTYCDLWGLHRADFLPLLERFPRFKRSIEEIGQERGLKIASVLDSSKEARLDENRLELETMEGEVIDTPDLKNTPVPQPLLTAPSASSSIVESGTPTLALPDGVRIVATGNGSPNSQSESLSARLATINAQNGERLQNIMERLKVCSAQIQGLY